MQICLRWLLQTMEPASSRPTCLSYSSCMVSSKRHAKSTREALDLVCISAAKLFDNSAARSSVSRFGARAANLLSSLSYSFYNLRQRTMKPCSAASIRTDLASSRGSISSKSDKFGRTSNNRPRNWMKTLIQSRKTRNKSISGW